MAYRDDEQAREARIAALEQQARRADQLERRVREIEEENRKLRASAAERAEAAAAQAAREAAPPDVERIYVDDKLVDYIETLVAATRSPADHGLAAYADAIVSGARPDDAAALTRAAKEQAAKAGRTYALPSDIREVMPVVLGPRVILSGQAESAGVTVDAVLQAVLDQVAVP